MTDNARNAINEAQKWLKEHPNHHSARRKDVKALIAALEEVLAGGVEVKMQYALQVKGSQIRDEPHRIWHDLDEVRKHARMLKENFGDEYEIVERVKAGPWTVLE